MGMRRARHVEKKRSTYGMGSRLLRPGPVRLLASLFPGPPERGHRLHTCGATSGATATRQVHMQVRWSAHSNFCAAANLPRTVCWIPWRLGAGCLARGRHSDSKEPSSAPSEDPSHGAMELWEREVSRIRKRSKLKETPTDAQTLLVIQPDFKSGPAEQHHALAQQKLEEAVSLAEAITDWKVAERRIDAIRKVHSHFLFGKGKTSELERIVKTLPISGVFINTLILTPLQHKTLEELFKKDVFDRFSIVLQIFKERAKTREAKVQVELAEIPYLRTHLIEEEREGGLDQQRGGMGKMGGGGETALTIARRSLNRKEKALKEELEHIRMKHKLALTQRSKHHLPVVAVVGYTNAGKTTLVKALSKDSRMHPEDMLFATLDTTMHAAKLPCGLKVLLVDTIGFISDLPHELVESFSSTLEDVATADVLVQVCDAGHPQASAHKADVMKVLSQLKLRPGLLDGMIEVLNKTDKLGRDPKAVLAVMESEWGWAVPVSAKNGEGLDDLMLHIEAAVLSSTNQKQCSIVIPADGPQLSWLYHEATVTSVELESQGKGGGGGGGGGEEEAGELMKVKAILSEAALGKFTAKFGDTSTISLL